MVAIWQLRCTEDDDGDPVDDCVLIRPVAAVEEFLSGVEGERGLLSGNLTLVVVRAAEWSLRELDEVAYIGRPERCR